MSRRNLANLVPAIVAACLAIAASAQTSDVPAPSDYAWGFPIHTDTESSFYRVQLPLEVNQSVTDPGLRDAGVYNAEGNAVPRIFEPVSDDVEQIEHLRRLPMLPLYASTEKRTDDIRLVFERDGDRTRLELNSDELLAPRADERLTSYIVDTRQLDEAVRTLEFEWAPVETGFIGNITIEGSGNLEDWNEIGSGTIADLQQDWTSIVQRRVSVQPSRHDYLRIRWESVPESWRLEGVQGEYVLGKRTVVRKSIMLESSGIDPDDGGRIFSLGGAPKVDRVRIVLTEPNTVLSARIYYWSEAGQRWIQAVNGSFHHIGRGNSTVRNGPARLNKIRTSRFKVVETRGRSGTPMKLEIGWRPDSLLFLAQGRGPYTLVAGSASDAARGFPQHSIFGDRSIAGLASSNGRSSEARLGPRYPLGGAASLAVSDPPNWRKLALWLGLGLGVAFVGFMASRVIRDLKSA